MKLITFSQEKKDQVVALMIAHREADEIVQGVYNDGNKGCLVGCATHGDHRKFESEFGVYTELAHLADCIHEKLTDFKNWPVQFFEAIPCNADLDLVWAKFSLWTLSDPKWGMLQYAPDEKTKDITNTLIGLYARICNGEDVTPEEFKEVRDRAYLADRADRADLAYLAYLADRADRADLADRADRADLAYLEIFWLAARDELLRLLSEAPIMEFASEA